MSILLFFRSYFHSFYHGVTISIVDYTDRSDTKDETTVIDEYFISKGNKKICTHRRETFKPDWKITGRSREYKGEKDKTEVFDNDYSVLVKDAEAFNEMEKFCEEITGGFKTERVEKEKEGGKYMKESIKKIDKDISEYESMITKVKEVQKTIQKAISKADIRLIPRGSERGCDINMFFGGNEKNFERSKIIAEELDEAKSVVADRKFRQLPSLPRFWKYIFVNFNIYNGTECTNMKNSPSVDEAAKILKSIKKVRRYNPKNDMRGKEVLDITDILNCHYNMDCVVNHENDRNIHLRIGMKPIITYPGMPERERDPLLDYIALF